MEAGGKYELVWMNVGTGRWKGVHVRAERAAGWTGPGDPLGVGAARKAGAELNSAEAHEC